MRGLFVITDFLAATNDRRFQSPSASRPRARQYEENKAAIFLFCRRPPRTHDKKVRAADPTQSLFLLRPSNWQFPPPVLDPKAEPAWQVWALRLPQKAVPFPLRFCKIGANRNAVLHSDDSPVRPNWNRAEWLANYCLAELKITDLFPRQRFFKGIGIKRDSAGTRLKCKRNPELEASACSRASQESVSDSHKAHPSGSPQFRHAEHLEASHSLYGARAARSRRCPRPHNSTTTMRSSPWPVKAAAQARAQMNCCMGEIALRSSRSHAGLNAFTRHLLLLRIIRDIHRESRASLGKRSRFLVIALQMQPSEQLLEI